MSARLPDKAAILDVLATIDDPEMPISIIDLGIVADVRVVSDEAGDPAGMTESAVPRQRIEVDITPTFIGCPALDMIRDQIRARIAAAFDGVEAAVRFVNSPAWSTDRISAVGRERLRAWGVVAPEPGASKGESVDGKVSGALVSLTVSARETPGEHRTAAAAACPYCGSAETRMESPFGPTRCRMIYYCTACKNSFEPMRAL